MGITTGITIISQLNNCYSELINSLIPDKSQQETFFKECYFVALNRVPPDVVLLYSEGFVKINPQFKLLGFLFELEKSFNQKRQNLALDFSNYGIILKPEQLQMLYAGVSENKALSFIQTFFSFILDFDAVFTRLLTTYWQQLKNSTIFDKFLIAIKNSFFSEGFEFGLECFDIKEPIRGLLLDVRPLWIFGLKYLAENPQTYEQLMQEFNSVYHEVLEKQHGSGYCALAPAN